MAKVQLAQVNIARLIAPQGDPRVAEFFDNVPHINQLAEASPGFIWRYEGEYTDPMIAFNLSVWESITHLSEFVYRSAHVEIFRMRDNWFTPMSSPNQAMWWVEPGTTPDVDEALRRLNILELHGPTVDAFTFTERFELA